MTTVKNRMAREELLDLIEELDCALPLFSTTVGEPVQDVAIEALVQGVLIGLSPNRLSLLGRAVRLDWGISSHETDRNALYKLLCSELGHS